MCTDCRRNEVDCHSGTVVVEVSGWGTWNIWLDTEPEGPALPSVLLGPRDALKVAWHLVVAAVRLWRLQRRDCRVWNAPLATQTGIAIPATIATQMRAALERRGLVADGRITGKAAYAWYWAVGFKERCDAAEAESREAS